MIADAKPYIIEWLKPYLHMGVRRAWRNRTATGNEVALVYLIHKNKLCDTTQGEQQN